MRPDDKILIYMKNVGYWIPTVQLWNPLIASQRS